MSDRCPLCGERRYTTARDLLWVLRHPRRAHRHWTTKKAIERSSLGTPEAKALREQADPALVERVMERVRELRDAQATPEPPKQARASEPQNTAQASADGSSR